MASWQQRATPISRNRQARSRKRPARLPFLGATRAKHLVFSTKIFRHREIISLVASQPFLFQRYNQIWAQLLFFVPLPLLSNGRYIWEESLLTSNECLVNAVTFSLLTCILPWQKYTAVKNCNTLNRFVYQYYTRNICKLQLVVMIDIVIECS